MLVDLRKICQIAEKKKNAVGAFNVVSIASLHAILDAAEELELPVILQFAQCHECYVSIEDVAPLVVRHAERASVPVCVHVDHGEDADYIRKGLELGFTGVMFDGSALPYEQNRDETARLAELAHAFGAGIEAELGSMGARESGNGEAERAKKIYTDPALAKRFVDETGIDALACSFGTTHGIYLKAPKLDTAIVSAVRKATHGIPVVMHGGSGVPDELFRESIRCGVRKINYFTYMDRAGASAVKASILNGNDSYPIFSDLTLIAAAAMKENVKEAMKVFALS